MSWNYRVLYKKIDDSSEAYSISECYYSCDGSIYAWTDAEMAPFGEALDELRSDLAHMLQACERPVLYFDHGSRTLKEKK